MGVMRFVVDDVQRITDSFLETVYIASLEGVPWRCFAEQVEDGFQIKRRIDESGSLFAPWQMPDGGQLLLSTANLRVRERPYLLPVELARGTLNRLRNQTASWRQAGLLIPSEVMAQISAAAEPFCTAATSQQDVAAATAAAEDAIRESLRGCEMLLDTYIEQLARERMSRPKTGLMFGANVAQPIDDAKIETAFTSAFNMAAIHPSWAKCEPVTGEFDFVAVEDAVDWAKDQNLKIMLGPALSFDPDALPDWLVLWEEDLQSLQSYVVTWVREVVERFRGEISIWHCGANMNSGRALSLSDEQRLKLSVAALETIHQVDPKTPVMISFDQPWCEYMTHANTDVAPLHYADALARANLGVAGLGLHIDWGFRPGGTIPRNPLELSQLLDQWSMLGLPLVVFLTMPSSLAADPQSRKFAPLAGTASQVWTVDQQNELATQLTEICWSKQSVQGVIWNQTFDAQPHKFPHAGLVDADGKMKPLLASLQKLRNKYLT